MIFHRHHIIPTYDGGTDDPSNIVKVNTKMHAFLHYQRYVELGKIQDLIAARGLLGLVGKDQIIKDQEKRRLKNSAEAIRKTWENGREAWNKGKTGIYSEETLEKLRRPKSEEHKQSLRKPKSSTERMRQSKSEEHNKSVSRGLKEYYINNPQAKKELSNKLKQKAMCPKCGMQSNKSNITRHIKADKCQVRG